MCQNLRAYSCVVSMERLILVVTCSFEPDGSLVVGVPSSASWSKLSNLFWRRIVGFYRDHPPSSFSLPFLVTFLHCWDSFGAISCAWHGWELSAVVVLCAWGQSLAMCPIPWQLKHWLGSPIYSTRWWRNEPPYLGKFMFFGKFSILSTKILTEGMPLALETLDAIESWVSNGIPSFPPLKGRSETYSLWILGRNAVTCHGQGS